MVVGAIVSLAVHTWVFTVVALLVHAVVTLFVGYVVLRVTTEVEKPGPLTVARLQAAGVDDPEAKLNLAIQAHAGGDAARESAAGQQTSITPTAEETDLVGPDFSRNGRH